MHIYYANKASVTRDMSTRGLYISRGMFAVKCNSILDKKIGEYMVTCMGATLALLMFLMSCSILSGQAIAQEYQEYDDEYDEPLGRLLVADGETGLLQLIELDNGEVIETFMVEGSARVYTTESGRIAGVVQTGANRVDFIDSGDTPNSTWAFVVSGQLEGVQNLEGYLVTVRNLRTNAIMTNRVRDGYFAAATADLSYQSVVQVGDTLEVTVADATGEIA